MEKYILIPYEKYQRLQQQNYLTNNNTLQNDQISSEEVETSASKKDKTTKLSMTKKIPNVKKYQIPKPPPGIRVKTKKSEEKVSQNKVTKIKDIKWLI